MDESPFSKVVSHCAAESGSWLRGVVSVDGVSKVEIAGDPVRIEVWLESDLVTAFGSEVEVEWLTPADTEGASRIVALHLNALNGVVTVDLNSYTTRVSL